MEGLLEEKGGGEERSCSATGGPLTISSILMGLQSYSRLTEEALPGILENSFRNWLRNSSALLAQVLQ